jgi:hypothetical protein
VNTFVIFHTKGHDFNLQSFTNKPAQYHNQPGTGRGASERTVSLDIQYTSADRPLQSPAGKWRGSIGS